MDLVTFDPYYTVNKQTLAATKTLLANPSLDGEDKSQKEAVRSAKLILISAFDVGMAHQEFRKKDSGAMETFNKYLDCIFRLKPNIAPDEIQDEYEFLNKNSFLLLLFQNIAESAVGKLVNKNNIKDALLRTGYLFFDKKNTPDFEYRGDGINVTWGQENDDREMKFEAFVKPAKDGLPARANAALKRLFKAKPSE